MVKGIKKQVVTSASLLRDRIKSAVLQLSDISPTTPVEFTILQHSHLSTSDLYKLQEEFPTVELRYMIPLTAERLILHECVASLQAFIQQEDRPEKCDTVFQEMIEKGMTTN